MNYKNQDLNLLRIFDALVTERHVSRAALKTGLSQPAMSHALRRLRQMLNDPLLIRSRGVMQPTPAALRLAPEIRDILRRTEALTAGGVPFDPATCRRSFVLGTSDFAAAQWLPAISTAMNIAAPLAQLIVRHIGRGDGVKSVENGEVDLAIGTFHASRLRSQIISEERYACAVWKGAKRSRPMTLKHYLERDHILVEMKGEAEGAVDFELARRNLSRRIARIVPHFLVAPGLVRGTDLVLTLPESILHKEAVALELKIFNPPLELPKFRLELLWHERNERDEAVQWFRSLVLGTTQLSKRGRLK